MGHVEVVYCSKDMEGLRKEVRKLVEFPAPDIQWAKFNDGFPDVFVENIEGTRGKHVIFMASFADAASILEQLAVIYVLPRYTIRSFTVVLT